MNKYLPDNIDDFFSRHLENYSEEPEADVWDEIDKRLSAGKNDKRSGSRITVIGTAAILLFCLGIPFLIKDNFMHYNIVAQNKTTNHISNAYHKSPAIEFNDIIETPI